MIRGALRITGYWAGRAVGESITAVWFKCIEIRQRVTR